MLIGAFSIALAVAPAFTNNYELGLLTLFCIYAVVTVGLDLLVGNCGQPSFGHSGFFALGAYGLAVLVVHFGLPLPLAALITVAMTIAAGLCLAIPGLRLRDLSLAIATFAFAVVIQTAIVGLQQYTGGVGGMPSARMPLLMPRAVQSYYLALLCLLVGILIYRALIGSRTGRAWRAVATNEAAATAMGISPNYYKTLAFLVSAVFAGVAGMAFALNSYYISSDTFAPALSISFFAMVVVGGRGSILGALLGVSLYVFLPEVLQINTAASPIIFGLIILVTLRFFPGGLVGLGRRLFRLLEPVREAGTG